MIFLYTIFLSYAILASLINAIYAYRISKMSLSPTFTYSMYTIAFGLRFGTYIWGLFYIKKAIEILHSYESWIVVLSTFIETAIMACMLIFIVRKYRNYKNLYKQLKSSRE